MAYPLRCGRRERRLVVLATCRRADAEPIGRRRTRLAPGAGARMMCSSSGEPPMSATAYAWSPPTRWRCLRCDRWFTTRAPAPRCAACGFVDDGT
jgi:hypothetical protein